MVDSVSSHLLHPPPFSRFSRHLGSAAKRTRNSFSHAAAVCFFVAFDPKGGCGSKRVLSSFPHLYVPSPLSPLFSAPVWRRKGGSWDVRVTHVRTFAHLGGHERQVLGRDDLVGVDVVLHHVGWSTHHACLGTHTRRQQARTRGGTPARGAHARGHRVGMRREPAAFPQRPSWN